MKLKFAHICDSTILSKENKLSVIGIFSEINAQRFPMVHGHFDLALCLEFEEEDAGKQETVEICLRDPEAKPLRTVNGKINVPPQITPGQKVQLVLAFDLVTFTSPGMHQMDVSIGGQRIEAWPLNLIHRGEQNASKT
ncbi:MAG: hypothetical protein IH851_13075 [Armatimonadetes bacterium]|nr:hypothetical protein [Armatimonadota bacterium]